MHRISFFLVFTRQIYRHCCRLASSRLKHRTQAHRWRALQLSAVQNVIRRLSPVHTNDKVERAEFDFVVSVTGTAHEVEISWVPSCAGGRHNMNRPSPPSVGAEAPRAAEPTAPDRNVAVGSHAQYVPTLTAAAAWRVNAAVSKAAGWPWPSTFWPIIIESGVQVTCDVGYLCAKFSLPRPLCSRLRPDVRDRHRIIA